MTHRAIVISRAGSLIFECYAAEGTVASTGTVTAAGCSRQASPGLFAVGWGQLDPKAPTQIRLVRLGMTDSRRSTLAARGERQSCKTGRRGPVFVQASRVKSVQGPPTFVYAAEIQRTLGRATTSGLSHIHAVSFFLGTCMLFLSSVLEHISTIAPLHVTVKLMYEASQHEQHKTVRQ